jgi:hypothetical protein
LQLLGIGGPRKRETPPPTKPAPSAAVAIPPEPRADIDEGHLIGDLILNPGRAKTVLAPPLAADDFRDPRYREIVRLFMEQLKKDGKIKPLAVARLPGYAQLLRNLADVAENCDTVSRATEAREAVLAANRARKLWQIENKIVDPNRTPDGLSRGDWLALAELEARARQPAHASGALSFGELASRHDELAQPVIDGLIRRGETMNNIGPPKIGKSWQSYHMLLCVATGRPLFGRFATTKSSVLLVDNELHPETIANRIGVVADAMGVAREEFEDDLMVLSLRGHLRRFADVADDLRATIDRHSLGLIVFDSKYRFAIDGTSENDNAAEALFYNEADRLAADLGAALAFVHHSSRGEQGTKRVTDVGSGAGSQSRAVDCHAILREHERSGAFVFDAALRSFPPVAPLALRWEFPLWVPAAGIDPAKLRGRRNRNEERQEERDREGANAIIEALRKGPATAREVRRRAGGMGKARCDRLLDKLESEGRLRVAETTKRGNSTHEYSLPEENE